MGGINFFAITKFKKKNSFPILCIEFVKKMGNYSDVFKRNTVIAMWQLKKNQVC
jgi:hypothetical protein